MNLKKNTFLILVFGLVGSLFGPISSGFSDGLKTLTHIPSHRNSINSSSFTFLENSGGRPKKKPKMMQRGQKKKREYEEKPFNVDVFLGYAKNYASGDFIEYQKQYHTQGTEVFATSGSVSDFNTVSGGIQIRGFPFMDHEDFKSKLSGIIGVTYLRKGFTNDVQLQNNSLNYTDITQLKETFRANYLSTYFMARFGRLVFIEAGLNLDIFINGARSQQVTRTTSGENAFKEPFTTSHTANFTLSSKLMSSASLGFIGGIGYQIHPLAGIRVSATINTHFFKEAPNFTNFQPSIQAFFTMN